MTTVVEIALAADPEAWRAVGFAVDASGILVLGGIQLRLAGGDGGISGWVLADAPNSSISSIDGLPTAHGAALGPAVPVAAAAVDAAAAVGAAVVVVDGAETVATTRVLGSHPNEVSSIDHVVVYTPDLERTCTAIEAATGSPLRRIREVESLRQGFHRLGDLIVEVVNFPGILSGHAEFWGLALNTTEIDALYDRCGDDVLTKPKNAVQQGRRIASFRKTASLGLPVAVMTPHVRR